MLYLTDKSILPFFKHCLMNKSTRSLVLLLCPFPARQLELDLLPGSICCASNRIQVSWRARGAAKTHNWAAKVPGFTPDYCVVLDKSYQPLGQTMHSLNRPWQVSQRGKSRTSTRGLSATGWHGSSQGDRRGHCKAAHLSPDPSCLAQPLTQQPRALLEGSQWLHHWLG